MRDPYDVLGVGRSASEAEVKRAYRKLAKAIPPRPARRRAHKKAQAKFAEINSAYEILGDKDKRGKFDRGEIDAEGKPRFQGFEGFRPAGRPGRAGGFENIDPRAFADIFSGLGARRAAARARSASPRRAGRRPRASRPAASKARTISSAPFSAGSAADAARGGRRPGAPGADMRADVAVTLEDIAAGRKPKVTLPTGKTVALTLPKGVADGQVIRLQGQGQPSLSGGAPGDALVTVRFVPHPLFKVGGRRSPARSAGQPRRGGARRKDRRADAFRQGAGDGAAAFEQRPRAAPQGQGPAQDRPAMATSSSRRASCCRTSADGELDALMRRWRDEKRPSPRGALFD